MKREASKGTREVTHFTDLEVWRRSHALLLAILEGLQHSPKNRYTLTLAAQVLRCVGSIGANIAEGFNRSQKKYLSALDIAIGETNEAENWLYKARDAGLLDKELANRCMRECISIAKMLHGLVRSIRAHPGQ